jgi:hypothetical protein
MIHTITISQLAALAIQGVMVASVTLTVVAAVSSKAACAACEASATWTSASIGDTGEAALAGWNSAWGL